EIRVALERRLLPPFAALRNRQHDRIAGDAAGLSRRRALVREVVQVGTGVARRPLGAVNRDDVADIAEPPPQLDLELLEPRPVLARHLRDIARRGDAGVGVAFSFGNEELNGLVRLRLARAVRVVVVEVAARNLTARGPQLEQRSLVVAARD